MYGFAVSADIVADFQKQRHCVLGNRLRAIGRYVGNKNSSLTGCFDIDYIITGSEDGDKSDVRTQIHGMFTDWRFVGDYNFSIADTLCNQ